MLGEGRHATASVQVGWPSYSYSPQRRCGLSLLVPVYRNRHDPVDYIYIRIIDKANLKNLET